MRPVRQLIREEFYGFQPRLLLVRLLVAPLPEHTCSRLRTRILRWAGFRIGHGTTFAGMPAIAGSGDLRRRVSFGRHCWMNTGLRMDAGATITIQDHVVIGHEVMFVTSTHAYGGPDHRAGPLKVAPIVVEAGAWLGARCAILPGVTIGRGAVVAAGAVVNRNVPPNTLVGGVPARVLRELPGSESEGEGAYAVASPLADAYRLVNATAVIRAATEN
jgi:maltose O-acetyltransferase